MPEEFSAFNGQMFRFCAIFESSVPSYACCAMTSEQDRTSAQIEKRAKIHIMHGIKDAGKGKLKYRIKHYNAFEFYQFS